jgi:predicted  nucleic acid-binding Zn-ribbon protein
MITLKINGEEKFFIGGECRNCNATGKVSHARGRGYMDNLCFDCGGRGVTYRTKKAFDTLEEAIAYDKKLDARRDRAEARREAKRAEEFEATRAEREARAEELRLAEEARALEVASYKHLDASIGDVVIVAGKVVTAVSFEGKFGAQRLIVVETASKELVKMFTTAGWSWNVERDEEIVISGEVSSFDSYEGKAQTQLRKPKLAK